MAIINGSTGNDTLSGTTGSDSISGLAGNDSLVGSSGHDTLAGGTGNDTLRGGTGLDTYRFDNGDGQDVIYDDGNNNEVDTLVFGAGIVAAQTKATQADNGRDIVITVGTDKVTLDNVSAATWSRLESITFADGTVWSYAGLFTRATLATTGDDRFWGDERANALSGSHGNDTLSGGAGDDTLYGGRGADSLTGGYGSDTYRFERGDGQDVVYDEGSNGETDTVAFGTGITTAMVRVAQADNGRDLVLKIGSDQLTLDNVSSTTWARIERVTFADGSVWTYEDLFAKATAATTGDDRFWGDERANALSGSHGNDTLNGGSGDDTLHGGRGVDSLNGGYGNDTYRFERGDGQDAIYDEGANGENDTLAFGAGITAAQVKVAQADNGRDIVLKIGTDQITLDNVASTTWARIEQVTFADGTIWTYDELFAKATAATSGNDTIWGDERANTLNGSSGDDSLIGHAGNDILNGGIGNDTLHGGVSGDRYAFGKGGGQDVIYDEGNSGEADSVIFGAGLDARTATVSQADNGRDIVIRFAGGTDQVTLDNVSNATWSRIEQFSFADGTKWTYEQLFEKATAATSGNNRFWGDERANTLSGAAGNDTLSGGYGNDTLAGGTGNDSLNGGTGNDTYRFARGDGADVIFDEGSNAETDVLAFAAGITAGQVTVSYADGNRDLVLKIAGTTDQVTLDNVVSSSWARIEQVTFADGTVWSYDHLIALASASGSGLWEM